MADPDNDNSFGMGILFLITRLNSATPIGTIKTGWSRARAPPPSSHVAKGDSSLNSERRLLSSHKTRACRNSRTRQCLGFSTADLFPALAYESVEKNPNIAKVGIFYRLCLLLLSVQIATGKRSAPEEEERIGGKRVRGR